MRDGWVRVDERLPEAMDLVLMWSSESGPWPGFWNGEAWILDPSIDFEDPCVTHWQPIEGPGDGDE